VGVGILITPESIACLIDLSRDDSSQVRDYATFGLRLTACDTPAIRQAFVDRLSDEDAEVRGEAMLGLAENKDPRVIAAIRAELQMIDLEGFCAIEAAELAGESSLFDDLVKFREAIDDEHRVECGQRLNRAIEACRPEV
jgi:HEAT repeat protein